MLLLLLPIKVTLCRSSTKVYFLSLVILLKVYPIPKQMLVFAKYCWEVTSHPLCSSDLAPSNYHLFRSLQVLLNGKNFRNYDDLKLYLVEIFAVKLNGRMENLQ